MAFCSACGFQMEDNVRFCPNCGAQKTETVQVEAPVYQQPTYPAPMRVEPQRYPRPGRGLGIAAMILGIVAQAYTGVFFIEEVLLNMDRSSYYKEMLIEGMLPIILVVFAAALLAVIFASVAKSKGNRSGQSASGLILGSISLGLLTLSLTLLLL